MIKWHKTEGYRSYESEDGLLTIMYYQNAQTWKLIDDRYLPQPISKCWAFTRTLAEAKRLAELWTQ
jgi:hypothetical protein